MNIKNLLIIIALFSANIISFIWGKYHTLLPYFFLFGLIMISAICLWASQRMETRNLIKLSGVTMMLAYIDEYVHTSSGAFRYFDGNIPSPLTVFGWSLLVLGIISISKIINQRVSSKTLLNIEPRILIVLITIILFGTAWLEGYMRFFDTRMILLYLFLFLASIYYSNFHKIEWSLLVSTSTLIFSAIMEYIGGIEGLWVYQNNRPIAVFIIFTWVLRNFTILSLASMLGVDFLENTCGKE